MEIKKGFGPVCDAKSRLLILGSFPSVKSREVNFYYGNKRNAFWRVVCGYFGEQIPDDVEDKRSFLLSKGVALWDIVTECQIEGSNDASIKNFKVAHLDDVLKIAPIELIVLNGSKAYDIFCKYYSDAGIDFVKLPSTSPANTFFDEGLWVQALDRVFRK